MKLAPTPFAARQLVNHGHVLVNGRRVNIPSYQLSDGDTIELRQRAAQTAISNSRSTSLSDVFRSVDALRSPTMRAHCRP